MLQLKLILFKVNGKEAHPDNWHLKPVVKSSSGGKANLLTLFRTPNMAKKTLILYFNWFTNSFVYYGLTLNSGNLVRNCYTFACAFDFASALTDWDSL